MISFKRYCEEFIYHDAHRSSKEGGASVAGASENGIMSRPKAVSTAIIGDTSGFSGNNEILSKNLSIPFEIKYKQSAEDLFVLYIKYNKDDKYIPLSSTEFSKKMSCEFDNREDAVAAIRDLKFQISEIDLSKK